MYIKLDHDLLLQLFCSIEPNDNTNSIEWTVRCEVRVKIAQVGQGVQFYCLIYTMGGTADGAVALAATVS
jgi:hypothetical protein